MAFKRLGVVEAVDYFWGKVRVGAANECWPWLDHTVHGYGLTIVAMKRHFGERMAHRVAWVVTYGVIPDKLCLCHTCDNRPCCNPHHLFLGTHQDNMDDRTKKGRARKPRQVTKREAVIARSLYRKGLSMRDIATAMGTFRNHVSTLVRDLKESRDASYGYNRSLLQHRRLQQ